jgi:hypothetical protein
MCGARWCISPSKKNSFDYFPYFFVVLHGHKSEGGKRKKKKNFSIEKWKGPAILCFAGRLKAEWHSVYTHTHTHTRTAFRSLCYYHRLLSISFGFRVGAQKRNGTKSFFFLFLPSAIRGQSTILSQYYFASLSLSDLSSIYAGIAVCVCLLVPFIIPSPGRFFVVIDGFFIFFSPQSLCVAFGPVYLPYNNKAPLCFHLRT